MSNPRQNSEYVMLREAIKKKNKVTARKLILNNASVNVPRAKGNTPLHWAIIKFGDLEIMIMLLDRGANIHAKNHRRFEPLKVAIQYNKTQAALLLIERGALVGEDFNSLLLTAIEQKNAAIVKILIDNGMQYKPSMDLKTPLYFAILRGQPKIIEQIIPNCRFLKPSDKYIPREVVIKSDPQYKECVELLLKWHFTVNPNSKNDIDFAYAAVKNGYLPIILQLLQFGLDVDMVNPKTGLNLLKIACLHRHYEIVENLLKQNACLNVTTPTNTEILNNFSHNNRNHSLSFIIDTNDLSDITCLHIAVTNRDSKMTKLLLGYGATIIDDPKLFYITCIAIQYNYKEIVRIFLDHGVNVNDIDSKGKTLLHYCLLPSVNKQDSRYDIAKILLEKGADVHIQTPSNSLLFEAVKNEHRKIAQLFLDYNADIRYIAPDGDTVLHMALKNDFDVKFIVSLLKRNSPVNVVNKDTLTPLLIACKLKSKYQVYIIKALLEYNANVHCTDKELMTPLHFACQDQSLEIVRALLKRGADPNVANNKGQTPLHLACGDAENNECQIPLDLDEQQYVVSSMNIIIKPITSVTNSRIIQLLFQYNANIEAVDGQGRTPIFVACKTGTNGILQLFLNKHVNVNHTDYENLTPLYIAAKNCKDNSEIVKILLKHKVNVHCMDKWGNSIIHVVVDKNNAKLIQYLADTQINFNSVNKRGNTPLHIAVRKESVKMTNELIKYGANINVLDKKKRTPLKAAIEYRSDYRNIKTYENHIHNYREILKILKIQVIKLRVAGLKVNHQNLNIVNNVDFNDISDDEFTDDDFYDSDDTHNSYSDGVRIDILKLEMKCEREIEKMKSTGIDNITYYDLLTRNIHFLCRFVKNKYIRVILDFGIYDEKFPLYMDIIRSRFRDAKFRYRMMHSAKKYFISNITQRLSDNCIDTIFSYLNVKELKMLIRAMKPLNV